VFVLGCVVILTTF